MSAAALLPPPVPCQQCCCCLSLASHSKQHFLHRIASNYTSNVSSQGSGLGIQIVSAFDLSYTSLLADIKNIRAVIIGIKTLCHANLHPARTLLEHGVVGRKKLMAVTLLNTANICCLYDGTIMCCLTTFHRTCQTARILKPHSN